ncbi:MAG: hypothetical protein ABIT38_06740, partial [Gemmatimonadaceae bacterium]
AVSSGKRKRRRYSPAWAFPGHTPGDDPARAAYWTARVVHATDVATLRVLWDLLRATLPDSASRRTLEAALDRRRQELAEEG